MTRSAMWLAALLAVVGCAAGEPADDADAQAQADRALVEAFEAAARAAINTPSMESTFHAAGRADWARMLRRQQPATAQELATARRYFQKRLELAQAGLTWPQPPRFDIPRATVKPKIDGDLDDPAWQQAATFQQSFPLHAREPADKVRTTWKMLWDEQFLYFAFECGDVDVLAPMLPRDGDVYKADCVEMFILPRFETAVYWEIIISPAGTIYDGLQAKPLRAWGAVTRPELDVLGLQQAARVRGTLNNSADRDEGYSVEVAVPFSQLPEYHLATPQAGQTIRLMLVRLDGESQKNPSVYSFIPLLSWGHNIWNHAQGRLVGP